MSLPRIVSNAVSAAVGAVSAITIYAATGRLNTSFTRVQADVDALKSRMNMVEEDQRKSATEALKARAFQCNCDPYEYGPYPG